MRVSKVCQKCFYETKDDSVVFCPACGSVFDGQTTANNAAQPSNRHYAQPVNGTPQRHYARPLQMQAQQAAYQPNAAPQKTEKPKKRLPYILIGFFAAAAIFTVLLVIVLNAGSKLAGTYTWTNGANGGTGSLVITESKDTASGIFTYDGVGTVQLSFDTKDKAVSFTGTDGTVSKGTYELSGDDLSITIDNYTDTFRRK